MSHSQHLDVEGKELPSVSQVPNISSDLFFKDMDGYYNWICKSLHPGTRLGCCVAAAEDYYKDSANLGNDIHALMEAFLQGEEFKDGVPEYQAQVFEPVARFFKESGYEPIDLSTNEYQVVSGVELKMTGKEFGGTLDTAGTFFKPFWEKQRKTFWADYDDKVNYRPGFNDIWIVDLKIKSKLDALHPLQLYGYALLMKEVYGVEVKWGLIIRREKKLDKTPQIQLKGYYLPAYSAQWDAAMLIWKFLNK